jgi:hypothetical protein
MKIEIKLKGVQETIDALRAFPDGARFALVNAIKSSLISGRQKAFDLIRKRYNVPEWMARKQMPEPSIHGLTGTLEARGSKVPAYLFPGVRDNFPEGGSFQEMREGPATVMRHAFTPSHQSGSNIKLYQRWEQKSDRR